MTSRGARHGQKIPAGRLRRAQTFLRSLGIDITFAREGRTGRRIIRPSTSPKDCVGFELSRIGLHWEDIDEDISIAGRGDMTRKTERAA